MSISYDTLLIKKKNDSLVHACSFLNNYIYINFYRHMFLVECVVWSGRILAEDGGADGNWRTGGKGRQGVQGLLHYGAQRRGQRLHCKLASPYWQSGT